MSASNGFYTAQAGETAPPIPDGPKLCEGDGMRMIHNVFLWAYERAPQLVRSVAAGDTARGEAVSNFLRDMDAGLAIHHEDEDLLLWDRLEQRAPACALHVGQMRAQHREVHALLEETAPLKAAWTEGYDPAAGAELADAYQRIFESLRLHLRREVVEILPVAEKVITAKEWAELPKRGRKATPLSRILASLGFMVLAQSGDPSGEQAVRNDLPGPIIGLYKAIGRKQFAKNYAVLFPGEPVPRPL